MIWIALTAVVAVAAGAWFGARTWPTRGVIMAAGAAALGAYAFIGRPAMPDAPLAMRLEDLEQQARVSAESMTVDQMMALIQKRANDAPDDPEPHKYMGDLLEAIGKPNEAILSYQSALRRDPQYRPAIKSLADLLFRSSGRVDAATTNLYREAYRLDPSDLRVGYMAGIGDWQAGRRDEAEALWDAIEAEAPPDDPRQGMFKALRETFGVDTPPGEAAATPSGE